MTQDFEAVLAALKPILAKHAKKLSVQVDTATEYTLVTKSPSVFPQHKGQPLYFGGLKVGKAYVSFHLMALYMAEKSIPVSPALQKRKQGKACFNFKAVPEKELVAELKALTELGVKQYAERKWL